MKKKIALIFAAAMVISSVPVASISADRPMNLTISSRPNNPLISPNPTISANPNALKVNTEYYFKNAYSGKYLEAISGDKHSQLKQNDFTGSANQKFKFTTASNGSYSLVPSVNTELKCDISGASSKNGTKLQLFKDNPSFINAQTFKVVSNGDGTYRIITNISKTEKVVEVAGPSKKAGAKVQIWNYVGAKNQKWILEEVNAAKPEDNKEEAEKNVEDYVGISLTNKLATDNLTANIKVTNSSDKNITTTDYFKLETLNSRGQWIELKNFGNQFGVDTYTIASNSVFPMACNLTKATNESIVAGKYRITKEFKADGKKFTKAIEFEVEKSAASSGRLVKLSSAFFNKDSKFTNATYYLYKDNSIYSNTEPKQHLVIEDVKKINEANVSVITDDEWNNIVKDKAVVNKIVFKGQDNLEVTLSLYGEIADIGYMTLSDGKTTYKLAASEENYKIPMKLVYDKMHMSMPQ